MGILKVKGRSHMLKSLTSHKGSRAGQTICQPVLVQHSPQCCQSNCPCECHYHLTTCHAVLSCCHHSNGLRSR